MRHRDRKKLIATIADGCAALLGTTSWPHCHLSNRQRTPVTSRWPLACHMGSLWTNMPLEQGRYVCWRSFCILQRASSSSPDEVVQGSRGYWHIGLLR